MGRIRIKVRRKSWAGEKGAGKAKGEIKRGEGEKSGMDHVQRGVGDLCEAA